MQFGKKGYQIKLNQEKESEICIKIGLKLQASRQKSSAPAVYWHTSVWGLLSQASLTFTSKKQVEIWLTLNFQGQTTSLIFQRLVVIFFTEPRHFCLATSDANATKVKRNTRPLADVRRSAPELFLALPFSPNSIMCKNSLSLCIHCSLKMSRVCTDVLYVIFRITQKYPPSLKTDIFTPTASDICFDDIWGDLRQAVARRTIRSLCPHLSTDPSTPSAKVQTHSPAQYRPVRCLSGWLSGVLTVFTRTDTSMCWHKTEAGFSLLVRSVMWWS